MRLRSAATNLLKKSPKPTPHLGTLVRAAVRIRDLSATTPAPEVLEPIYHIDAIAEQRAAEGRLIKKLSEGGVPNLTVANSEILLNLLERDEGTKSGRTIKNEAIYYLPVMNKEIGRLLAEKKPIISLFAVHDIHLNGQINGHVFCIYIDEKGAFLCDNNGNEYDGHTGSNPIDYGNIKKAILDRLGSTGLKVATNKNPTFKRKEVCSFAAVKMAKILAQADNPREDILDKIDELSDEQRAEVYPTKDIKRLEDFAEMFTKSLPKQTSTGGQLR